MAWEGRARCETTQGENGVQADNRAIERRLGELLVVVRMVEILLAGLSGNLKAVGGARAQGRIAASHEFRTGAIWLPPDQAVLVLAIILIREVDVVCSIGH